MAHGDGNVDCEYLILGAGPAGLQLGHHLSRAGRACLILERGEIVRVEAIHGPGSFRLTDSEGRAYTCLRLIVAAGGSGTAVFDEDCRPDLTLDDRSPALTCEGESTNVPGLYFAGGFSRSRHDTQALFRMLEARYHARPWPAREVAPTADGVLAAMIPRLDRTSVLWQHGFHDLVVMPEDGGPALHFEEVPLAYIQESDFSASSHYYTLAMEPGAIQGDPFAAVRPPQDTHGEAARDSAFLHPVVRRWNGPLLVAEHHLPEDPHGEWAREDARLSLRGFLREQMRERVRILAGWD